MLPVGLNLEPLSVKSSLFVPQEFIDIFGKLLTKIIG